ncbi:MAG: glutaredoxin domain-containing protein [Candidatus ainarchaeum sp.]|nr:glutaredoxin domain-containing protein [Candidatus ainarchaeum sp.]
MTNITVYSTKMCPYCVMAKKYLESKNIAFTDVDVSSDYSKALEMVKKSGQQGVPVIDIDGQIIVGFDRQKIDQILK